MGEERKEKGRREGKGGGRREMGKRERREKGDGRWEREGRREGVKENKKGSGGSGAHLEGQCVEPLRKLLHITTAHSHSVPEVRKHDVSLDVQMCVCVLYIPVIHVLIAIRQEVLELEELIYAYFVLSYSNHEHSTPLGVLPFISFPVVAIQVVYTDRGGCRFGGTQEMRGRGQEKRRRG